MKPDLKNRNYGLKTVINQNTGTHPEPIIVVKINRITETPGDVIYRINDRYERVKIAGKTIPLLPKITISMFR